MIKSIFRKITNFVCKHDLMHSINFDEVIKENGKQIYCKCNWCGREWITKEDYYSDQDAGVEI